MASAGSPKCCLELLKNVGKLKHLKRTGWVMRKVPNPETVSGHMYRMSIAAMMFDHSDNVDTNRVLRMCLVHDMAESIVGDITPHCGVTQQDKHEQELTAMTRLAELPAHSSGQEMLTLFKEYEDQSTPEAHVVKDLDRFDMILQAFEYEISENKPGWLDEFFTSTEGKFKHPRVVKWVQELYRQRHEFITSSNESQATSNAGAVPDTAPGS
uniref:5'-deoxynucleotidase HDDC2 n=1 Tax=Hirondellea gigas TaxID=1518452 RepID=A0A2P2I2E4_9CRUS